MLLKMDRLQKLNSRYDERNFFMFWHHKGMLPAVSGTLNYKLFHGSVSINCCSRVSAFFVFLYILKLDLRHIYAYMLGHEIDCSYQSGRKTSAVNWRH